MKFTNEGTWFYFNDENPDDGGVCLKSLTPGDVRRIESATTTKKAEYKKFNKREPAQRFEWLEVDEEKRQEMQWDALIADWAKVDPDGEGEIDCTHDNKIRMMNEYADFATFIGNSIVKLVDQEPTEEDLEKNS